MKIRSIDLGLLRAPLKTPFKTALRTVSHVEDIIVRIHTDSGETGWGGAAATAVITGDTHGGILDAIERHIAPRILGREIAHHNANIALVQSALVNNSSAKAAVEIALYDLLAQYHQTPGYQLLGGGERQLDTDITISVNPVDIMVNDALAALEQGFSALKIKVGKDIASDIERVHAIHAAVAGRATLRLDANQGWSAKQAVSALHQLENSGVQLELVEQPVKAGDLAGLKFVTERVHTPVMADEAAFGPREVIELIRLRAADIVNIKLMKTGGLSRAIQVADLCALHDIGCMMGCMLESPVSVAAAAHLAAAHAQAIGKIDLDSPSLCAGNPVVGDTVFDGARITLGQRPGFGVMDVPGLVPLKTLQ